jgi:hypothetical protein
MLEKVKIDRGSGLGLRKMSFHPEPFHPAEIGLRCMSQVRPSPCSMNDAPRLKSLLRRDYGEWTIPANLLYRGLLSCIYAGPDCDLPQSVI